MTTSIYRTVTGTLTAAQINDLKDTNPLAIPAPAADEYIVVHWAFMFLDHGGTDFIQAAGTDHQALRYTGGVEIDEIGSEAQYTAFIEAAADASLFWPVQAGYVPTIGEGVEWDNNGATDHTTGDGTINYEIGYSIVRSVLT